MEKTELLEQARKAFIKKYAQTPEQAGYQKIEVYKDDIVFAVTTEVFDAYVNSQKLSQKALTKFIGIAFLIVVLIAAFLYTELSQKETIAYIFAAITIALMVFVTYMNHRYVRRYEQWENLCKKEGNLLFYSEGSFSTFAPEPILPETAFF